MVRRTSWPGTGSRWNKVRTTRSRAVDLETRLARGAPQPRLVGQFDARLSDLVARLVVEPALATVVQLLLVRFADVAEQMRGQRPVGVGAFGEACGFDAREVLLVLPHVDDRFLGRLVDDRDRRVGRVARIVGRAWRLSRRPCSAARRDGRSPACRRFLLAESRLKRDDVGDAVVDDDLIVAVEDAASRGRGRTRRGRGSHAPGPGTPPESITCR